MKDGDRIIVDSENRALNWLVDADEQAQRKKEWDASDKGVLKEKRGVLFKYARDVAVSVYVSAFFFEAERRRFLVACKCRCVYRLRAWWDISSWNGEQVYDKCESVTVEAWNMAAICRNKFQDLQL